MTQTRPNGAKVFTNGDMYNLAPDVAELADSLNVLAPVATVAARDAIKKFVGLAIIRTDLTGLPIFIWDGAAWSQATGLQHAEFTGPAFTTTATAGTNFGGPEGIALVTDTTKTINNDFALPISGGRVQILQDGVYAIQGIILPQTVPQTYSVKILDSTSNSILASNGGVGYGDKEQSINAPNSYLKKDSIVTFSVVTSNAVTMGSRVRVTKVQ